MRQPRPKQVAFVIDEDLRFVLEAPERRRMNDPVAVPLEVGSALNRGLGVAAAA